MFRINGLAFLVVLAGVFLGGCTSVPEKALTSPGFVGEAKRGSGWWMIFGDATLNRLMERMECGNLQLRAAKAGWTEEDHDGGRGTSVRGKTGAALAEVARVERICDLRLILQSRLAQSYFNLRFIDEERRILRKALEMREANLRLATKRFETGLSSEFDREGAEAELSLTQADLARMSVPRRQLESAIGFLVGTEPSCFRLDSAPVEAGLPELNPDIPLCALGARPDVAAAVARLKLAHAGAGMTGMAYFPETRLSCPGFLDWSCRTLAFCGKPEPGGASTPGDRQQRVSRAILGFQQTVLAAMREVEESLARIEGLASEREAQLLAVHAANRTATLSRKQFEQGVVTSSDLIGMERRRLEAERRLVQIRSQQFGETVRLVEALGGCGAARHFSIR